ncbi:PREDICTED: peptidyl-prolyl cis-trans isomerase FKBP9 [Nanorana parkeri]|uniref:peptidyl-prolyl cis-trans isomerase FKBP9 n=1 Tax=Nanorana parkeri TaxID=125878 RepID=UPI0008540346|nr:PREDICTED: peptidyl-prolyl cis-trans isomerase FKBP9 [Nanorana parkeri]
MRTRKSSLPALFRMPVTRWSVLLLQAVFLVSFVTCNDAPPVPAEQLTIEKSYVPELCPRSVKEGDFVRYHYHGLFPDGTKFDSSYDRGTTYNVFVGKGQIIQGMDKALIGMCVNERRLVKVPPSLAYGKEGVAGVIPPDAIIHFDVLLLDIWNPDDKVQTETYYKPEICSRTVQVSDFIRYHYNGTLLDGTLFDSSHNRMKTYDTYIGIGWLIPGMDTGLLGMCVGERRIITVPPFLAYGEDGDGKDIPPKATLAFDVVLLDLHNPKDGITSEVQYMPDNCERKTQAGDYIRYHYNGTLLDGTFFDSSYSRNRTYNTYIGKGYVISGMDEGLLGLCVGERRRITIPPHLAYGEEGRGKDIPPKATLAFDVVLLDLHNPKDGITSEVQYMPDNCERKTQAGDYIRYHYNGTLLDGTFFDSSYSRNRTYNTYIGKGYVISGMDEGLLGLCVGERRRITIPPHLAYGEEGRGKIPGSAVLVFEILVVDFHNPDDSVSITAQLKPINCTVLSKKGDYLKYHYNATLMDGTVLDSTHQYGKTYNIVLESGQVVMGMDIGLRDMCVGERRTVIIPPHLGYGEAGVEGEVPGSAVLIFDIELLELIPGLPDGYMFVWNGDVSPNLFEDIDKNSNGEILLQEFADYIKTQVDAGKGKLAPGFDADKIIENMYKNQDRNEDGKITEAEFKLKDQEDKERHDEL